MANVLVVAADDCHNLHDVQQLSSPGAAACVLGQKRLGQKGLKKSHVNVYVVLLVMLSGL